MNSNIFAKANQIAKACDTAYIGVLDDDGFPNVSTVSTIKPESIFEAHFATGMASNKVKRLLNDKRASVCYHMGGDNITLIGEVQILTDQDAKSKYWLDWFIDHFPGGETDPNYCIIMFTTKRASLWIDNESAEFMIDEFLHVKSVSVVKV
jgi:general stress protein 26